MSLVLASDGLAIFGVVLLVIIVVGLGFIGWSYSDGGGDASGMEKARSVRAEHYAQIDDLGQMVEAANERRRAQGLSELDRRTANRHLVPEDPAPAQRAGGAPAGGAAVGNASADLDDIELDHALKLRNAQLRREGKPEMTKEQLRALMGGG